MEYMALILTFFSFNSAFASNGTCREYMDIAVGGLELNLKWLGKLELKVAAAKATGDLETLRALDFEKREREEEISKFKNEYKKFADFCVKDQDLSID